MTPIIQIFGVWKCRDTNKAVRFFKERRIKIQFVDLNEKGLSRRELESVTRNIPPENLIDREGKEFRKRNLGYMVYDVESELLSNPLLFKTPVIRFGKESTVGYEPEQWKKWVTDKIKNDKD